MASISLSAQGLAPRVNPNAQKTMWSHLVDYAETANGVFRIIQLLDRVNKVVLEALKWAGSSLKDAFENFGKKLAIAWTMLAIPRLIGVWTKYKEAVGSLGNSGGGLRVPPRAMEGAFRDGCEATATTLYVVSTLTSNPMFKTLGDVPDLALNAMDLKEAGQQFTLARKAASLMNLPTDVQHALVDTQRYALLKLVKAVSSIVGGLFGFSLLLLGGPLVPAIVLIALSLLSTAASMTAHFYKETRPFQPIKFFENQNVQQLVPLAV